MLSDDSNSLFLTLFDLMDLTRKSKVLPFLYWTAMDKLKFTDRSKVNVMVCLKIRVLQQVRGTGAPSVLIIVNPKLQTSAFPYQNIPLTPTLGLQRRKKLNKMEDKKK